MDTFESDVTIVGAGVVGLAVARAFALSGREVLVLEAARRIGGGVSSRNSGVIHSGLYDPPGSLKARLCVEGRRALYGYCLARDVPVRACGKIIVACGADDVGKLVALARTGEANGVEDLRLIDRASVRELEPEVEAQAALLCPSTGIIDGHALMEALRHDVEAAGGAVCLATPVTGGTLDDGLTVTTGGREPALVRSRTLVNAAGLGASAFCRDLAGFPARLVPEAFYAKGSYFALSTASPFRRLVYPLPEQGGLGVHATIDLAGRVRFGPDVQWVERPDDVAVDPARAAAFEAAIRRYWPGLPDEALSPDYAGIRPKIAAPGEPSADFLLQAEDRHGVPGLINLFGIESPGLTASMAIAAEVVRISGRPTPPKHRGRASHAVERPPVRSNA